MELGEAVRKVLEKNAWLNGWYDYLEGDPMAVVEEPEKFSAIAEVSDVKELFSILKNYEGTFKFGSLLFFNSWKYGCFVYNVVDPEDYIEHLTVDAMTIESFMEILKELMGEPFSNFVFRGD